MSAKRLGSSWHVHFLNGAHRWARNQGIPGLFLKIAGDRDFTFIAKMNLVGEKVANGMLVEELQIRDKQAYMHQGIIIQAHNLRRLRSEKRRVHSNSMYSDKLQLLYAKGAPADVLRFMYAVAQVRNAYLHELRHLERRILDVIYSCFSEEEGQNVIDALMYQLDSTLGRFAFEGSERCRGNCGSYVDFHGRAVNLSMRYSAKELRRLGGRTIDREIKSAITFGARHAASLMQGVIEIKRAKSHL